MTYKKGMSKTTLDMARDAAAKGDYRGVVQATSGTYMTDLWAAAMTAQWGPTGLHESWRGEDGRPSAEAMALPDVAQRMRCAEERVHQLVDWYTRHPE